MPRFPRLHIVSICQLAKIGNVQPEPVAIPSVIRPAKAARQVRYTAESAWALLKRQIFGIHHWVSDKHLNRYVSEMTWRFNRRDMKTTGRMNDLFTCVEGRLTYKALIG